MIPFFPPPVFELGPLQLHGFGLCVATAILTGSAMVKRRVRKLGLDENLVSDFLWAIFIVGFIGAHLFDVLIYRPKALAADPLLLFKVWNGISSFGGFFGALAGSILFFRWRRIPRTERWGYSETILYSLPFGWVFGRLGCSLAHDHPGIESTFPLAIAAPPPAYQALGFPNHPFLDLGLLELLYTIVMVLVLTWLDRKRRPVGFYLTVVPIIYAPVRFGLDFLRVVDVRYFGLTPGQYASLSLFAIAWIVWRSRPRDLYVFDKLTPLAAHSGGR